MSLKYLWGLILGSNLSLAEIGVRRDPPTSPSIHFPLRPFSADILDLIVSYVSNTHLLEVVLCVEIQTSVADIDVNIGNPEEILSPRSI